MKKTEKVIDRNVTKGKKLSLDVTKIRELDANELDQVPGGFTIHSMAYAC